MLPVFLNRRQFRPSLFRRAIFAAAASILVPALLTHAQSVHAQELTEAQQYFQQGYELHTAEGDERNEDKALKYYRQALKLDPELFPALSNAALIYYGRRDYKRAKHFYSEAIKSARADENIPPSQEAKLYSDLGGCYFQEGNLKKAEDWFRAAIQIDSGLVEAHYNLINLMLKEDRTVEAKEALAIASSQAPSSRYGLFEGRLKSQKSMQEWNPTWLWVVVSGLLGGIIIFAIYRSLKSK